MRKRKLLTVGTEVFDEYCDNWFIDYGPDRLACQSFASMEDRAVWIFLDGARDCNLHNPIEFCSLSQASPVFERRLCTKENL